MLAPVEHPRHHGARDQDEEGKEAGAAEGEFEWFHKAPITWRNGRMTRCTKAGWKSQNAGSPATASVNTRPVAPRASPARRPVRDRCASSPAPCRRKYAVGR